MEHIITLAIHAAQRPAPDATENNPAKVYDGFAGVSSTSTRPEGPTAGSQMIASGWTVYQETSRRQLVKIELPEGVEASPYTVGGVKLYGLLRLSVSCMVSMPGRWCFSSANRAKAFRRSVPKYFSSKTRSVVPSS